MAREFENLTEAEIALRSVVYAYQTKDLKHKNHPRPLGNEFLAHQMNNAIETMKKFDIPFVEIDKDNYE